MAFSPVFAVLRRSFHTGGAAQITRSPGLGYVTFERYTTDTLNFTYALVGSLVVGFVLNQWVTTPRLALEEVRIKVVTAKLDSVEFKLSRRIDAVEARMAALEAKIGGRSGR